MTLLLFESVKYNLINLIIFNYYITNDYPILHFTTMTSRCSSCKRFHNRQSEKALQTAIIPVYTCLIWWMYVDKRRKIGPYSCDPPKIEFLDAHISGAWRGCPLKISQLVEDDQHLLMHTSTG